MTLTENGKIYIAQKFGVNNCFAGSGLSWVAVDINDVTASESGGTAQIVARLLTPSVYKEIRITVPSVQAGTYTNPQLIVANDGQGITTTEVSTEIAGKDGSPIGEEQYCAGTVIPPPPTEPGFAGVFEFRGPPEGIPAINLDLSLLEMRQNPDDYHFEMNKITITSLSDWSMYIALEVRLFSGALDTCPSSGAVFVGMDRVSTTRNVRIIRLDPDEIHPLNADFYQPETILGPHTVCLLVHGTWTKAEMELEIGSITG